MFLVSSNAKKLAEIKRYGLDLDLRPGVDLPEVEGTIDEVITHKAIAAGAGAVVEDTVLIVDGQPVVDIRWRLTELGAHQDVPVQWVVSLGHHAGNDIHLYRGVIHGVLRQPSCRRDGVFGFDPYFIPEGETRSLDDLEQIGKKDDFSARRRAVEQLINHQPFASFPVKTVQTWSGQYQGKTRPRP
jgi:inosine/xanthosine triphosphate pyrophosphatase family protein